MWCGNGPQSALDHPCQDDNASIDAVLSQYKTEWSAIHGVTGIGSGINLCGYFEEITVFVSADSDLPSVRAQIPESIGGVPVAVIVPHTSARSLIGFGTNKVPISEANVPRQNAQPPVPADTPPPIPESILREHSDEWMKVPGVVGGGTASGAVELTVQPSFMKSARMWIPSNVDGVAIQLTPAEPSGCQ